MIRSGRASTVRPIFSSPARPPEAYRCEAPLFALTGAIFQKGAAARRGVRGMRPLPACSAGEESSIIAGCGGPVALLRLHLWMRCATKTKVGWEVLCKFKRRRGSIG